VEVVEVQDLAHQEHLLLQEEVVVVELLVGQLMVRQVILQVHHQVRVIMEVQEFKVVHLEIQMVVAVAVVLVQ